MYLRALSISEQTFSGNLCYNLIVSVGLTFSYLHADLLEDIIFRDIGRLGGMWHNWAFFVGNCTAITLGFILKHFVHGDENQGGWR